MSDLKFPTFKDLFLIAFSRAVHKMVGKVHVKQIYEIAKIKQRDEHLAKIPLETLCRIIVGSCRSAGLEIVKD